MKEFRKNWFTAQRERERASCPTEAVGTQTAGGWCAV